ncbi:MAG: hydrogenase expression/formation protein HypE [Desulfamplus sp.]|nr:hydrogenase expression/formation protein HypE [Desulfamplus sp.]
MILPLFNNDMLSRLDDGASITICSRENTIQNGTENVIDNQIVIRTENQIAHQIESSIKIAFSTDSYVVDPIFFPGGNIGELAINGTVNDIAMCGGDPKYISAALILEEGFSTDDLKIILNSMAEAAKKAGVFVVTGDTKVVPKGKADKIFINTSGLGVIPNGVNLSGSNAKAGDKVIISGTIADHGITILSSRENLKFDSDIKSDTAPLNLMVKRILNQSPIDKCPIDSSNSASNFNSEVHVLRDPTRGGVGTTLNEIASQSNVRINIWEDALPIKDSVRGMCELLGFDPLYLANEGKLLAVVSPESTNRVLEAIRQDEYGKDAAIIGEVVGIEKPDKPLERSGVFLKTSIGGFRIVDMLTGEQLPRIC